MAISFLFKSDFFYFYNRRLIVVKCSDKANGLTTHVVAIVYPIIYLTWF